MYPLLLCVSLVTLASASHNAAMKSTQPQHQLQDSSLIVHTTSGPVKGHPATWPRHNTVVEFLGIPYAQPPLGPLRFQAPKPVHVNLSLSTAAPFTASAFSQACMQYRAPANNATSTTVQYQAYETGMGDDVRTYGEDCLTVNVWSKINASSISTTIRGKAVMVWFHGGGFLTGTSHASFYNGARLAQDEDVVVVSFNYRLSIFGFPNAPTKVGQHSNNNSNNNNLGLLDQRRAVEWVRDNAAAFGGDPSRITLFGESSGAASVDLYAYVWTGDPIVNGFIAQSGAASTLALGTGPVNQTLWYAVTAAVGCGGPGAEAGDGTVLACMRTRDANEIMDAVGVLTGGSTTTGFVPTADEKLMPIDIANRTARGEFIKKPMLIGHNDFELGLVKLFPPSETLGGLSSNATDQQIQKVTEEGFGCPAGTAASARMAEGIPAWRYRYMGVWDNTALNNSTGAYHSSEIPIVMGTNPLRTKSEPDTAEEAALTKAMVHAWAEFAKDPAGGLKRLGWPEYEADKATLIRLGFQNQSALNLGISTQYDAYCS